jgi:uncharacterized protein YfiM (DUF2279 family)
MVSRSVLCVLLSLLPFIVSGQMWKEKDKHYHYGAGVVVSTLTYEYVYRKTEDKKKALLYSVTSAVLVGTLKELVDHNQEGNRFDGRDLLATTYGGLTVGLTFSLFRKNNRSKQRK